jgi:hypothetical protein
VLPFKLSPRNLWYRSWPTTLQIASQARHTIARGCGALRRRQHTVVRTGPQAKQDGAAPGSLIE